MGKLYYSWEEFDRDVVNFYKIIKKEIDNLNDTAIITIIRGGLPSFVALSNLIQNNDKLILPYYLIEFQRLDNNSKTPIFLFRNEITENNIIIVEDIIDKGITLETILESPIFNDKNIFVFSHFGYPKGVNRIQKLTTKIHIGNWLDDNDPKWVVFPWENLKEGQ